MPRDAAAQDITEVFLVTPVSINDGSAGHIKAWHVRPDHVTGSWIYGAILFTVILECTLAASRRKFATEQDATLHRQ